METLQEQKLRAFIREGIRKKKQVRLDEAIKKLQSDLRLRSIIQSILLKEASDVTTDTPNRSTGINVLGTVLKLVIPIIKQGYEQLTTSFEQRRSYRAHIIQNAINILMRVDMTAGPNEQPRLGDESHNVKPPENPELEADEEFAGLQDIELEDETEVMAEQDEDIEVEVGDDDKFISIDAEEKVEEPLPPPDGAAETAKQVASEKEFVKIRSMDKTGMEMAQRQFPKIAKQIADGYAMLSLKVDKEDFADFLIANLKMYFDQFDQEEDASLTEPASPEYKDAANTTEKFASEEEVEVEAPLAENQKVLNVLKKLLPNHEYFKRTP